MSRSGLEWDRKSGLLIRERTGEAVAKSVVYNSATGQTEVVPIKHPNKKKEKKQKIMAKTQA